MKKYDILYGWLRDEISRISESATTDRFANGLGGAELDLFSDHTEALSGFREELDKARVNKSLFPGFEDIRDRIKKFAGLFPAFPDLKPHKIETVLILADKLISLPTQLDEVDIDDTMFTLRAVEIDPSVKFFSSHNSRNPEDSLIIVSMRDREKLLEAIGVTPVLETMVYQLIAAIVAADIATPQTVGLVKKAAAGLSDSGVEAFVKLQLVADGKVAHPPQLTTRVPSILDRAVFNAMNEYQQLSDVLDVLSEYNARTELLPKFLTLYHVVENFMFKLPIVELQRAAPGRMFSIRDFRRLYQNVDRSEAEALKRLMEKVFPVVPVAGGPPFINRVVAQWNTLSPNAADVESVLRRLDLRRGNGPLLFTDFQVLPINYFSQLIYSLRNAVVHNKETELHLTDANLEPVVVKVMEEFVLPMLEQIVFHLIGEQNNFVWYSSSAIPLYQ